MVTGNTLSILHAVQYFLPFILIFILSNRFLKSHLETRGKMELLQNRIEVLENPNISSETLHKQLSLTNRLLCLKLKWVNMSSLGIDNKNYPSYIFKLSEQFSDEEIIYMMQSNVFSEFDRKTLIGLGIIQNFRII